MNLDTRRQLVAMMTLQGLTAREIATRFNVTERTIVKDRRVTGVSRPSAATDVAARRAKVATLTREGWTTARMAEHLKVAERTVERDKKVLRIARPTPRRWSDEEDRHALALIADGASLHEVAQTVGRTYAAVCDRFCGLGWTYEQTGQYNRLRTLRQELGV